MAYYKYSTHLHQNNHAAFDAITHPGSPTPYSGIYRCEGCGENIVSTYTHVMPPQNHHQHTAGQGAIRWRLLISCK